MSGLNHFLLSFCITGYIFCGSRAWYVKMPSNIKGLVGSCLVIPCSFDYYQYPPKNPDRVVWYQYVSQGYPLVYDQWHPDQVIGKFKSKTQLVHSENGKTCSLKIKKVEWSHHREKIYPWVDPENVGRGTYRFFDTTVTIDVVDTAEKPVIMISGDMKVGGSVQVECSVDHTCPSEPPTLALSIPTRNRHLSHTTMSDGTSRTTLKSTLYIENDHQTVECSVRHTGGRSASISKNLNAECSLSPLTISSTSYEFLEGESSKVTCTASYTCPKHVPTLTWNYESMPASSDTMKTTVALWKTVSTLTFTASANDHGRSLTCYAIFTGGQRQAVSITLRVKRNMLSRGWSFTTPGSIKGMRGSCIIIPCRFTYSSPQPSDLQVIWYLYQRNGYTPVLDQGRSDVSKFQGQTSLIGSVKERNCSLKIERLDMSHNQDRLYPWIDKNAITAYHTTGYSFYDKTTQLFVSDLAEEPQLSIIGIPRVGEQSTVSCSVRHTCLSQPPTLTLQLANLPKDTLVSDGIWERTVERTWTVQEEDHSVTCAVRYPGGQKATSELRLNVECPYEEIKMIEPPGEVTEGIATSVICSVSYKCKKNEPTIVWNFKDMQSSSQTTPMPSNTFEKVSNLTFIGSLDDDGKSLTCTAKFMTGETSDSATLRIKKYDKPAEERDLHEYDSHHVLVAALVPFRFRALTHSCVVIPCSFQYQEDVPLTRGIWAKKNGGVVFHNGQSHVLDHFKDRTRLLGDLNDGNCSLEIDDIKPFDNGPFCFSAEKGDEKYRFNNSCVFMVMAASPEKPVMTTVPAEVDAGSTISVSCSVTHTCSSHPPDFSWNVPHLTSDVSHSWTTQGIWETTSTITFMVAEGDGVKNLTCTAVFWRGKQQARTVKLNVKGSLMYQLRSSLPVSMPISVVVLIIIILAAVFGVFIWRKRKHADDSLKPPPRPGKRRSLWDRLSRRYPEERERPPRPEKRRSIWSRFSSRAEDGRVGWKKEKEPRKSFWSRFSRRQGNTADLSVGYLNTTTAANSGTHISKPRFPSPKDKRRPPRPDLRPEDYQVYANI